MYRERVLPPANKFIGSKQCLQIIILGFLGSWRAAGTLNIFPLFRAQPFGNNSIPPTWLENLEIIRNLTLPTTKVGGFSGYALRNRMRFLLKGLPNPTNIISSIVVSIVQYTTSLTYPLSVIERQVFIYRTTITTSLTARLKSWYLGYYPTSLFRFVGQ